MDRTAKHLVRLVQAWSCATVTELLFSRRVEACITVLAHCKLNLWLVWRDLTLPCNGDVEMDCLVAVDAIRMRTDDRSQHAMMINEVKVLLGERDGSITHISRL